MNALKDDLEQIAATPRPAGAPGVSPSAAVRRGRRIRRRRRALAAGGTALAVAAAGGVALAVPDKDGHSGRAPALQPAPAGYGTVLIKQAVFGWVPEGYTNIRIVQGDGDYSVSAGRPGQKAGGITLQLARGAEPEVPRLPGGRPGHRTPAAPVHGRPASWIIKPGADGSDQVPAEFRWQYADQRWAELMIVDRDVATEANVRRIAEAVRFGSSEAAAFPVRIGGVPSGMRVARAWVAGNGDTDIDLAPERGAADRDGLSVSLTPMARGFQLPQQVEKDGQVKPSIQNITIGGSPATYRVVRDPATGADRGEMLMVFGWHGMEVQIDLEGRAYQALKASGGAQGLLGRITYLGADQRKWTTTPLGK
ncbi:hypothetical protein [Actinomadura rupiterrae]|uniref:hypothetical protein n=1 Tax=Actinomadura rupiterrae TaxID=559627 RepID=UPI0020A4BE12|nr:hypothetical protein [Actinomadura rupiterrae]MCP2337086.1 hypothetical protein [Actinomadura rupiterrae]